LKEEIKLDWVKYIDLIGGIGSSICIYGEYIAAVGEGGVAFLDRSTGDVISRRTRNSQSERFGSCIVADDKLYVIRNFSDWSGDSHLLEFNRDLSISKEVKLNVKEERKLIDLLDIAYDGKNLYMVGKDLSTGRLHFERRDKGMNLVEYRDMSMDRRGDVNVNSIGFNKASNTLWAVGYYVDKLPILGRDHTLIIILGRDLNIVRVIDYPKGHESYLGELGPLCFDNKGYAYVASVGGIGIAKLDSRGNLVKISKGIPAKKILCAGELLYVFGNEHIDGYWRHVIYILDGDLKLLYKEVLSKDAEFDSYFAKGRASFDGTTIYVVGNDEALGKKRLGKTRIRWVVYSIKAPMPMKSEITPSSSLLSVESTGRLEQVLTARVKGLASGYGCPQTSEKIHRVRLVSKIAPQGFEGDWDCCLLGCGGWGCAYLCRSRQDNREVVFKIPRGFEALFELRSIPTVERKAMERITSEAEVVRNLVHTNILKLLGFSNSVPLLAYEYANNGSLAWQLDKGWMPSLSDILLIGIQVGDALRYIHSRGLVHSDIKPANVLIKDGVTKVGDFSLLVKLLSSTSRTPGFGYTAGFRAPEQVYSDLMMKARSLGYENRIDVYQLGNLLLYLLTGETIDGEDALDEKIVESRLSLVENKEIREVLKSIMVPDPVKRPSSEEVERMLLEIYSRFG